MSSTAAATSHSAPLPESSWTRFAPPPGARGLDLRRCRLVDSICAAAGELVDSICAAEIHLHPRCLESGGCNLSLCATVGELVDPICAAKIDLRSRRPAPGQIRSSWPRKGRGERMSTPSPLRPAPSSAPPKVERRRRGEGRGCRRGEGRGHRRGEFVAEVAEWGDAGGGGAHRR
uniref:Uncharacterized protein n=1 Tax=Oryza glumipatula TaxID=40148 RepID=A0A0E0ASJ2_9ORYZ